jgi:hypothetical protein
MAPFFLQAENVNASRASAVKRYDFKGIVKSYG